MTIESQKKSFLLSSLALAPTVWMLSFNFGVYKTVFLSLPNLLYYVVLILAPAAESIYSNKLLISLALITVLTGSLGFMVGHYHPRFLFCKTFEIAGYHLPENCWSKNNSR